MGGGAAAPPKAMLDPPLSITCTAWCSCTKCAAFQTERVCCCCRELAHTRHIFSDVEGLQCITDHPEFVGACRAGEGGKRGTPGPKV